MKSRRGFAQRLFWFMATLICGVVIPFAADAAFCWRDLFCRGVGSVPDQRKDADLAMDESLCYKTCENSWDGKATLCHQNCPGGYRDDGLFCARPAAYGRGVGYATNASGCAEAVLDMVVSTRGVLTTAATTAATAGTGTAAKAAATTVAKEAAETAVTSGAESAGNATVKAQLKILAEDHGKSFTEAQFEGMAKVSVGDDFDFNSLDPIGIAWLVQAYNKPICGS